MAGEVWLVAGLGNPGAEYERTRHNVGFRVLDRLASELGDARFKRGKAPAMVAETRDGDVRVILVKPATYMNLSGQAVGPLATYYKAPAACVVAVHDEIDLPFGRLQVKIGGGSAGHNGIRSLVSSLGTNEFVRLRIGVGRPGGRKEAADHVLDTFSKAEEKELPVVVAEAADAVLSILRDGPERAQNAVNTRN
ncbi:MAG TPA: aminoacyl-tRNA hydrolase [Actinomycetota bacterium]|nr:aminoacyl-tRNA hydrolase [Actinomycetota bacterium]